MDFNKSISVLLISFLIVLNGCISYSFTGTSIPSDVQTIYIPFFPDRSQSGLGNLSDRLNRALVNRFINQSRLSLANDQETSDAWLEGALQSYVNRPFSIGGDEQANRNEVQISVRATFQFASDEEPIYTKTFSGNATYDVIENPVEGELEAAETALQQIADNMFNDAVSSW